MIHRRLPIALFLACLAHAQPAHAQGNQTSQLDVIIHKGQAVFIQVAGDPFLVPVDEAGRVHRIANASGELFQDAEGVFWTRVGRLWVGADALSGTYMKRRGVPKPLANLAPPTGQATFLWRGKGPAPVIVRTRRTAFITLSGPLQLDPVDKPGGLHVVRNTEADLFFDGRAARYYLLAGGRWYTTAGLDAPWTPVSDVAAVFAAMPPDHPKGYVRAAIPGTRENAAAIRDAAKVALAKLPIDRTLQVDYAGEPLFRPIADIGVAYALNTAADVFETGGLYYACAEGAWYLSATARGPWSVCALVPDALYAVPRGHPKHYVMDAVVYPAEESGFVMVGTSAAYRGWHVVDGRVLHRSWYGPWPTGAVHAGRYVGPYASGEYLAPHFGNWGQARWAEGDADRRAAMHAPARIDAPRRPGEPARPSSTSGSSDAWFGTSQELEERRRSNRGWP